MSTYPGGKAASGVYQKIINQIPPHDLFISTFLGHDAVIRAMKPSPQTIGIDIDVEVIKWWEDRGAGSIAIQGDAISFLRSWTPYHSGHRVFFYHDPPYLLETRSTKTKRYKHEFWSREEHTELLQIIKKTPGMHAISGYQSDLYDKELRDWRKIKFNAQTRSGKPATEVLWMNYPEPWELHDYQYLGADYREREKIAKVRRRWVKNFSNMPTLKRLAIFSALQEVRSAANTDRSVGPR